MGNKRQRLARKNFKVVTGGGDPQSTHEQNAAESKPVGSSENGSKQEKKTKKKLSGKKRKALEGNEGTHAAQPDTAAIGHEHEGGKESEGDGAPVQNKRSKTEAQVPDQNGAPKKAEDGTGSKKLGSKHPLRVPGMRPGEGCFICKGTDHIAKLCPTKNARDRKKICLHCRKIGHTLKNCPASFETQESKFCYNCGENGHRLADCKKPLKDGGTGFAECFVCKKKGHLSKNCPTNPHGIYPKGGCCKLCQGVTHLAKDCPTKKQEGRMKLQISTAVAQASEPGGGGKRTVFQSGDDLGDDFVSDDETSETIVGALSYGSDDERPEGGLETGYKKTTPTPKSKKVGKDSAKSTPNTAGSTKMQSKPKVIKFQRPE
ncbi:unnamed protein product [Calypogeia fissa]